MERNTRIFQAFGVTIKNGGLHFNLNSDLEDEFDNSDYVIIRVKDLNNEEVNKLAKLLQGKFNKGTNG